MRRIQFHKARATLPSVVDQARDGTPSVITQPGRPAVVVLGFDEWQQPSRVPLFGRLLMMEAPLDPDDLPARQDGLRHAAC